MKKEFKVFRILSIIIFVLILLYVYAGLAAEVAVSFDAESNAIDFVSRDFFFYGSLLFAFVANGALWFFVDVFRKSLKQNNRTTYREQLLNWLVGFNSIINVVMAISVLFIGIVNNPEHTPQQLAFLVYLAPILFVVAMIWLLIILFKRKTN